MGTIRTINTPGTWSERAQDKGTQGLLRPYPSIMRQSINLIQSPLNFPTACSIGFNIVQVAEDTGCDAVVLVHNYFKNMLTYIIKKTEIMSRKFFLKNFKYLSRHDSSEPEKDFAQHYFYELYLGSIFYNALLHNNACEQSSRMNAMENASKNAAEMHAKLTLQYNKAR